MLRARAALPASLLLALPALFPAPARAQGMPSGPPDVGVAHAALQNVNQSSTFLGRVAAIDRVALVVRVTAYLEQRLFVEGSEVKQGQELYILEQPPFQATVQAEQAAVTQAQAQLINAQIQLNRAQSLLHTPAGQQSNVDDALATQRSDQGMLLAAQANLKTAEINLGYTVIRAPIDGQISATNINRGNVVTANSSTLATIVSQDPMYVTFPVPVRSALELQRRFGTGQGLEGAAIAIELPNGMPYGATGKIDYVSPTVSSDTDTLVFRAVMPNPIRAGVTPGTPGDRTLVDGMFVNVTVRGQKPENVLTVPLVAVLQDQQGPYVYVVGPGNKIASQHLTLGGQASPTTAVVLAGLSDGATVVTEGLQKVHPGMVVKPVESAPPPTPDSSTFQAGTAAATEGVGVTPFTGLSSGSAGSTQKGPGGPSTSGPKAGAGAPGGAAQGGSTQGGAAPAGGASGGGAAGGQGGAQPQSGAQDGQPSSTQKGTSPQAGGTGTGRG